MELKNDIIYKRIQARIETLILTAELRSYIALLDEKATKGNINKEKYFQFMTKFNGLDIKIDVLKTLVDQGILDLSDRTDIITFLDLEIPLLESRYPDKTEVIEALKSKLILLNSAINDIRPICIELMEFYMAYSKVKGEIPAYREGIEELLQRLPFDRALEEKYYLTNKCTVPAWYNALYFANPTSKKENYGQNFDALLKSTLKNSNLPRTNFLDKVIAYYSLQERIVVEDETLSEILLKKVRNTGIYPDVLCELLSKNAIDVSSNIEAVLSSFIRTNINTEASSSLTYTVHTYKAVSELVGEEFAIELFAKVLADYDQGDKIADALESYLNISHRDSAASFTEQYLIRDMKKQELRREVTMVLKTVATSTD